MRNDSTRTNAGNRHDINSSSGQTQPTRRGLLKSARRFRTDQRDSSGSLHIPGNQDETRSPLICYWNRPIGSPPTTMRLTIDRYPSNRAQKSSSWNQRSSSLSCWAIAHDWKDILRVLAGENDAETLTSTSTSPLKSSRQVTSEPLQSLQVVLSDATIWTDLAMDTGVSLRPAWRDVCLALKNLGSPEGGIQHLLLVVASHAGSFNSSNMDDAGHAQALLVQSLLPSLQRLDIHYPNVSTYRCLLPTLIAGNNVTNENCTVDDVDGKIQDASVPRGREALNELNIRYGAPMSDVDCQTLAKVIQTRMSHHPSTITDDDCQGPFSYGASLVAGIRVFSLQDTALEPFADNGLQRLLQTLEESNSLETVSLPSWAFKPVSDKHQPKLTSLESRLQQFEESKTKNQANVNISMIEYLQGRQHFHQLRRILLEDILAQGRLQRRQWQSLTGSRPHTPVVRDFEERIETIDSAIRVLCDWWRSTHRPPLPSAQTRPSDATAAAPSSPSTLRSTNCSVWTSGARHRGTRAEHSRTARHLFA